MAFYKGKDMGIVDLAHPMAEVPSEGTFAGQPVYRIHDIGGLVSLGNGKRY